MAVPLNMIAASDTQAVQPQAVQTEEETLAWSVHLLRQSPRRLPRIGVILLGTLILGLCVFHSFWLALLPMLALLFSVSEYIFPIHYTLTAQSATARHGLTMLEIRWADVRHAYLTDDGIKLSPLSTKNSRFEPLRGVYLHFDCRNRAAVMATVKRRRLEAEVHG